MALNFKLIHVHCQCLPWITRTLVDWISAHQLAGQRSTELLCVSAVTGEGGGRARQVTVTLLVVPALIDRLLIISFFLKSLCDSSTSF